MNNRETSYYREVCARMKINKHALDDELEIQADTLHRISEFMADARDAMERAEDKLDSEEADAFIEVSDMHRARKMNLDYIKNNVRNDPRRKAAWIAHREAALDFEKWENLYYAWKQRSYALTSLAELATASYYAVDSTRERRSDQHAGRREVRSIDR